MDKAVDFDWRDWSDKASVAGWLRPVDLALAELLARQLPETTPLVLLSAALTSAVLAQGHVCLPLAVALTQLPALLDPGRGAAGEGDGDDDPTGLPALPRGLTLESWRAALAAAPAVWCAGAEDELAPLVLQRDRLYLRRYWRYQETVAAGIAARIEAALPLPAGFPALLDDYFDPLRDSAERDRQAVHWQSVAGALAARRRFAVISGGPGTGKTTTVVRLLGLLQQVALDSGRPLRIHLAAPTGKAAARLTESIGAAVGRLPAAVRDTIPTTVSTLHRLLRPWPRAGGSGRRFRHGADNPLHLDLLVVDEASMVDLELMAQVIDALPSTARLILLGDRDQLASVEAGAVLGELCREAGAFDAATAAWLSAMTGCAIAATPGTGAVANQVALLRKSHRFRADSGIGQLAAAVNAGDIRAAGATWGPAAHELQRCQAMSTDDASFRALVLDGCAGIEGDLFAACAGYRGYLDVLRTQRPGSNDGVAPWASAVLDALGRFQLLTALRRGRWGVEGLNMAVAGLLAAEQLIAPAREGGDGWFEGRPVLVTRNDYALGLMNGDVGVALQVPGAGLRVFFRDLGDGGVRSVAAGRLGAVETAFAITVHKSQGSEFDHAVLVLPERDSPLLTRELIYTAITRARNRFTLVEPAPQVWNAALQRRVVRASGLGERLAELLGRD